MIKNRKHINSTFLKLKIIVELVLFSILIFSCKKEENKQVANDSSPPGKYFNLSDDNIDIFLPEYFEKFSADEYKELILSLEDSKNKENELLRFNMLKYSKGNVYYFKDILSSTLITVKLIPYYDFTKKESAQVLSIMTASCSQYAEITNNTCEKVTAGFSSNGRSKVFKALFKITQDSITTYNTNYFVSSNYKSLMINFYGNTMKNYNSYIQKLIIK